MNHLTDKQLELWLRSKEALDQEETKSMSAHLDKCRLCSERVQSMKVYYNELEQELAREPGEREYKIASKIYQKRSKSALPSNSLIQTYEAPLKTYNRSLPLEFFSYLRCHPVSSATVVAASVIIGIFLFSVKPELKQNPSYVEVQRNILSAYDRSGDVIWNIPANGMPNNVSSTDQPPNSGKAEYLKLKDIDGNKTKEILLTGDSDHKGFSRDTLYCLNGNGTMRWKQGISVPGEFVGSRHKNIGWWRILDFFVHSNSASQDSQLFAYARAGRWSPSVFYELEPSTGKILQQYWHSGHIQTATTYFNENSENYDLLIGAINDTYNKAALAVLNPIEFQGYAPGRELFETDTFFRAKEKFYITFKPSILSELYNSALYNQVSEIIQTDEENLIIHTKEKLGRLSDNQFVSIYYILDSNYSVIDVYGDDNFVKLYSDLYEKGELEEPLNNKYWESLKKSMKYWDENGAQFVSFDELKK